MLLILYVHLESVEFQNYYNADTNGNAGGTAAHRSVVLSLVTRQRLAYEFIIIIVVVVVVVVVVIIVLNYTTL